MVAFTFPKEFGGQDAYTETKHGTLFQPPRKEAIEASPTLSGL
jgi:hypothetical protein